MTGRGTRDRGLAPLRDEASSLARAGPLSLKADRLGLAQPAGREPKRSCLTRRSPPAGEARNSSSSSRAAWPGRGGLAVTVPFESLTAVGNTPAAGRRPPARP